LAAQETLFPTFSPLCLVIGLGKDQPRLVGKAKVVKLYLVKTIPSCFNGDINIVVPDLLLKRVRPREIFSISPNLSA